MNEKGNTLSHYSVFAGKICFASSFLWILCIGSLFARNPQGYLNLIGTAFNWIFSLSWLVAAALCVAAAIAKASRRDVRRARRWVFIGPLSFFLQAFVIWIFALAIPNSPIEIGLHLPW